MFVWGTRTPDPPLSRGMLYPSELIRYDVEFYYIRSHIFGQVKLSHLLCLSGGKQIESYTETSLAHCTDSESVPVAIRQRSKVRNHETAVYRSVAGGN